MTATPQTLASKPQNPNRALALLLLINLVNYLDRQVLAAVVRPISIDFFGVNPSSNAEFLMGLLPSAFLVTYILVSPVFGSLADRFSRWKIIAIGLTFWSLASGASGLAVGFTMLFVTRMLVGVGEAAYGPAAPTIIADLYPIEKRGRVLSWFNMAIPVGSALGYVFGGIVAARIGWRWAFYLSVAPGLLLAFWAWTMRDPPRGTALAPVPPPRKIKFSDYLDFFRIPSYRFNTFGMTAMCFALGGIAYWMPYYIVNYHHEELGATTPAQITLLQESVTFKFGVITVLAGIVGTLTGGLLGDWLRPKISGAYFIVSGLGMLAGFPLFLLLLYKVPFPSAWWLVFATEFCIFLNTGPTNTVLANVTHPASRSSAYALNILIIHMFGDVISPPLIGIISGATKSMNTGLAAVSVAMVVAGLCWLWGAAPISTAIPS